MTILKVTCMYSNSLVCVHQVVKRWVIRPLIYTLSSGTS